jgi:hypothetical protein
VWFRTDLIASCEQSIDAGEPISCLFMQKIKNLIGSAATPHAQLY